MTTILEQKSESKAMFEEAVWILLEPSCLDVNSENRTLESLCTQEQECLN